MILTQQFSAFGSDDLGFERIIADDKIALESNIHNMVDGSYSFGLNLTTAARKLNEALSAEYLNDENRFSFAVDYLGDIKNLFSQRASEVQECDEHPAMQNTFKNVKAVTMIALRAIERDNQSLG